ncbi:uncharacterized protein LOC121862095 isoform X2 [Homarus americanus]|uniref:uncharacterized protein LOC121862095 isoform X2 n=1 Tax=Homarus americanus TaxID=6706 RepID=UPI001C454C10|nr:uncharacterized protein LOC121862095 isoform X2 [Homarus americanus]
MKLLGAAAALLTVVMATTVRGGPPPALDDPAALNRHLDGRFTGKQEIHNSTSSPAVHSTANKNEEHENPQTKNGAHQKESEPIRGGKDIKGNDSKKWDPTDKPKGKNIPSAFAELLPPHRYFKPLKNNLPEVNNKTRVRLARNAGIGRFAEDSFQGRKRQQNRSCCPWKDWDFNDKDDQGNKTISLEIQSNKNDVLKNPKTKPNPARVQPTYKSSILNGKRGITKDEIPYNEMTSLETEHVQHSRTLEKRAKKIGRVKNSSVTSLETQSNNRQIWNRRKDDTGGDPKVPKETQTNSRQKSWKKWDQSSGDTERDQVPRETQTISRQKSWKKWDQSSGDTERDPQVPRETQTNSRQKSWKKWDKSSGDTQDDETTTFNTQPNRNNRPEAWDKWL